jgi:hypothetical protein
MIVANTLQAIKYLNQKIEVDLIFLDILHTDFTGFSKL